MNNGVYGDTQPDNAPAELTCNVCPPAVIIATKLYHNNNLQGQRQSIFKYNPVSLMPRISLLLPFVCSMTVGVAVLIGS